MCLTTPDGSRAEVALAREGDGGHRVCPGSGGAPGRRRRGADARTERDARLPQPARETADTIDAQGWLHSGDIGELDGDGYLRITDRKKEMIINIAGHNMSPANIETRLKTSSPLIGQAVCIGDARPYNVALLVLDPDAAQAFATHHGRSVSALVREPCVLDEVAAGVGRANAQLSLPEQIQRWILLDREWLPGGTELTPP